MIEKLSSQIAATTHNRVDNKNEKSDGKFDIEKGEKNEKGEKLSAALKNLTNSENRAENLERFNQNALNDKLKELVNKLLNQLNAHKNPNSPILAQANKLNFAPNFASELKNLAAEMAKNEPFKEVLTKLQAMIKTPDEAIKGGNLATLFKDSGVFLETKLKNTLNQESLPQSFKSLISAIKALSSDQISSKIAALASNETSAEKSLSELKTIINEAKSNSLKNLSASDLKPLLKLGSALENFKAYIIKNLSTNSNFNLNANAKLASSLDLGANLQKVIVDDKFISALNDKNKELSTALNTQKIVKNLSNAIEHFSKSLKEIKNEFFTSLNKPQNVAQKELIPSIKQAFQAFDNLENTLKNISKALKIPEASEPQNSKISKNVSYETKETKTQNLKAQIDTKIPNSLDKTMQNLSAEIKSKVSLNENLPLKGEKFITKNESKFANEFPNNTKIANENKTASESKITNDIKAASSKILNEKVSNESKIAQNVENKITQNVENRTNSLETNLVKNDSGLKTEMQEFIKENVSKNLAFASENGELEIFENLSKDVGKLLRKINENLKILEPATQDARQNLSELKNLDSKLANALKDINLIALKDEQFINNELKNDVKATLLQISNLAKSEGNEAIFNTSNRLLAQIEINQLMSLANESINTYVPFFWNDLNDSKVVFKRGKKDKFFTQIKLNFAKLGELEVLISLNNEKYIDINIMAENKNFRRVIYENAHELKRQINKAGLLSANFFVGDIVRSKFDVNAGKNHDLQMEIDKKV